MFQAWKLEQERLQKEEEEEKTKKAKSEPKGKPQEAAKPADAKKGSSSSSAGQTRGAEPAEAPPPAVSSSSRSSTREQEPRSSSPPPCVQAFVGLSTGGLLIRLTGRVQHLRPSDGGVVTVEDIRFAEGMKVLADVWRRPGGAQPWFFLRSVPAAEGGGGEGRPSLLHPRPPSGERPEPRAAQQR